jgi:NAD(P)-dependent dehydrogenase (short-subunit alcohol dehydrogenase family)
MSFRLEQKMSRLSGRIALITGGASGIGKATAFRFINEGAKVVISDIQDAKGAEVERELRALGADAIYLHHDVSNEASWKEVLAKIKSRYGGLDILFNNAGIGDTKNIEETSMEDYLKTISVTQNSVFLGMKLAADLLKKSKYASIINTSSIFGISGGFGASPAYHAAKGAVRLMTKTAALGWATQGIRVNSVHPGFIDTPILGDAKETEFGKVLLQVTPMNRLGLPEEVAAGVAYLASDDASFVTGSELVIDGGYLAR